MKPDDNSKATSSEFDGMPGSLGERQARSYRHDSSRYRGTALAVVGTDGLAVEAGVEDLLSDLLYEIRALRVAMMEAGTAADIEDGVENRI